MNCTFEISHLSAYYDGELEQAERQSVEEHLALCACCRERMASYAWLGSAIRAGAVSPAPKRLDDRVAALHHPKPKMGHSLPLPRPIWAAVLFAILIAGALTFGVFASLGRPTSVVAYPCNDPAACAIEIRFTSSVDRDAVERSVKMEPAVPFTTTWHGNTLLIKPAEPLQAGTPYALSVQSPGEGGGGKPLSFQFTAGGQGSPVTMATKPASAAQAPALSETPTPVPYPGTGKTPASPTPTPMAQTTPTEVPSVISCPIAPVRGFGKLYAENPSVANGLGCARETEHVAEMAIQLFEGGRMLWRGDRKEIITLLDSGRWRRYADTFDERETGTPVPGEPVRGFGKVWREQPDLRAALGTAIEAEHGIGAVVEEFEHGLLVWTADRLIYALYSDGSWEQYADTFHDPLPSSGTSLTTPVGPVPVLTGTITPMPAVSPSPTPPIGTGSTSTTCAVPVVRGFGKV